MVFTEDQPVIFAYHGYPWLIHRLYRRSNDARIHVRGYKEEGTTTTPFDMVMLNDLDRYHLVIDVTTGCRASGRATPACARRCRTSESRPVNTPRARRRHPRGAGLALARCPRRRR